MFRYPDSWGRDITGWGDVIKVQRETESTIALDYATDSSTATAEVNVLASGLTFHFTRTHDTYSGYELDCTGEVSPSP